MQRACEHARIEGFGGANGANDRIVIVAGMPFGSPGATNMIRIALVGEKNP